MYAILLQLPDSSALADDDMDLGLELPEFSEAALKKQTKINDKELTAVSIF